MSRPEFCLTHFLNENFSACMNLFQDFITRKEVDPSSITIAAASQGQGHQDLLVANPREQEKCIIKREVSLALAEW